jgi:peptide/histidine transporter 3/4
VHAALPCPHPSSQPVILLAVGTCYVTPLLGAFLADAYLGRYWVILLFSIIYMTGLSGLSASAGVSSLHPAPGQDATSGQLAFFWVCARR